MPNMLFLTAAITTYQLVLFLCLVNLFSFSESNAKLDVLIGTIVLGLPLAWLMWRMSAKPLRLPRALILASSLPFTAAAYLWPYYPWTRVALVLAGIAALGFASYHFLDKYLFSGFWDGVRLTIYFAPAGAPLFMYGHGHPLFGHFMPTFHASAAWQLFILWIIVWMVLWYWYNGADERIH